MAMTAILAVFWSSVALGGPTRFAGDAPMVGWTHAAADGMPLRVCYEGARVPTTAELGARLATPTTGGAEALQRAVAEWNARSHGARFRVYQLGERYIVSATHVQGPDGWTDHVPLLDATITLEPRQRTIEEALDAWGEALEVATGERVGRVLPLSGDQVTSAGGTARARDLLARILHDRAERGPDMVWSLAWSEPIGQWVLNLQWIPALESSEPPRPNVVPAQPVGTPYEPPTWPDDLDW